MDGFVDQQSEIVAEIGFLEGYLDTMEEFLEVETNKEHPSMTFFWDMFANVLGKSFFVSLYSLLEFWLVGQCRRRKGDDILLDLRDLHGHDGVDKAKVWFEKVLQIGFPSDTPEGKRLWDRIKMYQRLRNCITHNVGMVSRGFCENALEDVFAFMSDVARLGGV